MFYILSFAFIFIMYLIIFVFQLLNVLLQEYLCWQI